MEDWDAREGIIKESEPPRKRGWTFSKKEKTRERTKENIVRELEFKFLIKDLPSDLPEEGIILNFCPAFVYLLFSIQ